MTAHESFKRRVRARMAKTGERYAAARAVLLAQAASRTSARTWVSDPEHSEEIILRNTARTWDEWCDVIEAWPGHTAGHTAIAKYLMANHGVNGWWAQGITVGWERITGRRLPYQMADGTFTAGRSRTVPHPPDALRELLLDDASRADLFGGLATQLRSKPSAKAIRIQIGPGIALFTLTAASDHRTKLAVTHEKLPTADAADEWRFFWEEWLDALIELERA